MAQQADFRKLRILGGSRWGLRSSRELVAPQLLAIRNSWKSCHPKVIVRGAIGADNPSVLSQPLQYVRCTVATNHDWFSIQVAYDLCIPKRLKERIDLVDPLNTPLRALAYESLTCRTHSFERGIGEDRNDRARYPPCDQWAPSQPPAP